MKSFSRFLVSRRSFCLLAGLVFLWPRFALAQWPYAAPASTPDAQRNALGALKSQANWFQNATRTAGNLGANGYGSVLQQFEMLRNSYAALKQTLTPGQLADGANALAELDAGLNIIQEAFANYQSDVAAGRPVSAALNDMCQVLRQASQVWMQELNKTCSQLRVGRG